MTSLTYLPDHVPVFRCASCSLELGLQDELVSRAFSGARGSAGYLLRSVINLNIRCGEKAEKVLLTGKHTICSISCAGCDTECGWKYIVAPEETQRYKEGKSILEKDKIYKDNKW